MKRLLATLLCFTTIAAIAISTHSTFLPTEFTSTIELTPVVQSGSKSTKVVQSDTTDRVSEEVRGRAKKLYAEGNYKEAFDAYKEIVTDPKAGEQPLVSDLAILYQCIQRMRYYSQWDELIENVIEAQSNDWRVLQAIAVQYQSAPKYGVIIDNQWQRAPQRMTGNARNSQERDRIRGLQLLNQALPLAMQDEDKSSVSRFLIQFAQAWQNYRGTWRMQALTDLSQLPDYGDG